MSNAMIRHPDLTPDFRAILEKHQIRLKKSLGQNFLLNPAYLRRIIQAAELPQGAEVLEIGSGIGSLTYEIARDAAKVVSVEIDQNLFGALQEALAGVPNVTLVNADILERDAETLGLRDGYFVIANIPYYITSAIIRHLLEGKVRPKRIILTIQSEVAERICADDDKMSLLALSVQVFGKPREAFRVPASAFIPQPEVDSTVLVIDVYPQPVIHQEYLSLFFRLAKAGFAQKRKMLRNSLTSALRLQPNEVETILSEAGIDPKRRAETLALAEWRTLCGVVAGK